MLQPGTKRASLDAGVIRLAILGTITGICLMVIVFLLTEVRSKLDELASSPADNVQWTLAQLEVEYLEFQAAIRRARLSPPAPVPAVPGAEGAGAGPGSGVDPARSGLGDDERAAAPGGGNDPDGSPVASAPPASPVPGAQGEISGDVPDGLPAGAPGPGASRPLPGPAADGTALPRTAPDPAPVFATPAPAEALREVRRRYDILYSRFETLAASPLYNIALRDPALQGGFDRVRRDVMALARHIDSDDTGLRAALPALDRDLAEWRTELRRFLSFTNRRLGARSDDARLDVLSVLKRLAAASLVLLAALSAIAVLFRSLARVSQRRLEQRLVASARLETIFSTSRDAILMLDERGRIRNTNRAARDMFGPSAEEFEGQPVGRVLRREGAEGTTAVSGRMLFDACREGARTGYRLIGRRRDGHRFPVELSMDTTRREGAPLLVCVIRDVSHQVAAEVELKASRDTALAAERAKARFLGVISHEMRTPLNGILGAIDLLAENDDPAEGRRFIEVVRGSAQTLLQLVNDVLDITQIEGGDIAIRRAPFDLDSLLADILSSEAPRARTQENRLFRIGEGYAGWVTGDATRLRQVLLNLVSNAVKFTRRGSVSLEARREGDVVHFLVRDTGVGMSEAERARIFDDFVRLDSAIRHQVQGTGLGLGIARQLTRAMGGEIEVASAPGKGSVFQLSLPLPRALPPRDDQATDTVADPPAVPPQRILLVEDNPTNRFVARRMLERDGHEVTEAADGREGVMTADAERFDLILMDVSMPVMDGTEAAAAIRAGAGPNRGTRIVALTAHVGEEVSERLRAGGIDDVIAKPIRAHVIRRLLSEGHGAAGRASPRSRPPPGRRADPPDGSVVT